MPRRLATALSAVLFATPVSASAEASSVPIVPSAPSVGGKRIDASGPSAAAEAPSSPAPPPAVSPPPAPPEPTRPPPLHVEYAQYGVAIAAELLLDSGAVCPEGGGVESGLNPCIVGSGGGLAVRAGYRSPGPWYVGGAYEFIKMDSSNLYRLGIFQQLRAEMRYYADIGYRAAPYATWGVGGVAYGSEWGIDTGGALGMVGAGVEVEVSRVAVLGVALTYRPVILAGWRDTAGHLRSTGLVQLFALDLLLEIRSELGRR